ncbi:MAG: PP2C family protein-serine/threonine phosphatase [Thermoanaerobaculia bacterium]|nr:PP2C family protein-serine/threonine phosphatase [Thermoanaerobaculia bacterium]
MDYRALLKNVEKTLSSIERSEDTLSTIANVAESIVTNFRRELGIMGGRLYVHDEGQYLLQRGFGRSKKIPANLAVPAVYPPIEKALEEGLVITDLSDPGVDRELEKKLGVTRFAAVSFGEGNYLLSFDVRPKVRREDLLLSLGIIRTVLDSKVRTEKLEGWMNDARRIQQSILPRTFPRVADYDVFALTSPAEIVGGDFYDFIPLSDFAFGAAIADASGHGLLASLLVRDIYVGLRMGIGGDLKIARTIERLNKILNKSRLTTKFVSLFYGEFEADGEIIYVNAGHTPPLLLRSGAKEFEILDSTGMVLGPSPNAAYGRRAVKMHPGDVLFLYTDGIIEATNLKGQEFGEHRVKKLMKAFRKKPAQQLGEAVMAKVKEWSAGHLTEDDRTVVVIRRAEKGVAKARPRKKATVAPVIETPAVPEEEAKPAPDASPVAEPTEA